MADSITTTTSVTNTTTTTHTAVTNTTTIPTDAGNSIHTVKQISHLPNAVEISNHGDLCQAPSCIAARQATKLSTDEQQVQKQRLNNTLTYSLQAAQLLSFVASEPTKNYVTVIQNAIDSGNGKILLEVINKIEGQMEIAQVANNEHAGNTVHNLSFEQKFEYYTKIMGTVDLNDLESLELIFNAMLAERGYPQITTNTIEDSNLEAFKNIKEEISQKQNTALKTLISRLLKENNFNSAAKFLDTFSDRVANFNITMNANNDLNTQELIRIYGIVSKIQSSYKTALCEQWNAFVQAIAEYLTKNEKADITTSLEYVTNPTRSKNLKQILGESRYNVILETMAKAANDATTSLIKSMKNG